MKIALLLVLLSLSLFSQSPKVFLLKTYSHDSNLSGWVMSEKYDGVRALWDGHTLRSRSGKVFTPPKSFTKDFPPFSLDGELWTQRGAFEKIVSIVNTQNSEQRWDKLHYMVFEVPKQEGNLFERLEYLKEFLEVHPASSILIVKQINIKNKKHINTYFKHLVDEGAEGIVLRNPQLPYYTGRTKNAVKYKPFIDDECKVVSILEGKGKFAGEMGALECLYKDKIIKIGSGFNDKERRSPPLIGSIISFKYYGLTALGNPKYPVYLRVRSDAQLSLPKSR